MKKKKIRIEAVLPFQMRNWIDYSEFCDIALNNFVNLESLSERFVFDVNGFVTPIKIALSGEENLLPRFKVYWATQPKSWGFLYRFLKCSALLELDFSPEARRWKHVHRDKEEDVIVPVSTVLDITGEIFEHRLRDLLLCLTIAAPGTVNVREGALYIDGEFSRSISGYYSDLDDAILHAREEVGWPKVKTLPIENVWNWFKQLDGLEWGIGKGRIGRAVAALSYLVGDDCAREADLDIVWALLGLEAIYCRGNSGVMNQLSEKCQALLGPLEKKNIIQKMYALRSRVLHGNLDLPVRYTKFDADPDNEAFFEDTYSAAQLAMVMLVATLQQIVERDLKEVNFKYILDTQ